MLTYVYILPQILTTAGHVCLYRMSVDDQQWVRLLTSDLGPQGSVGACSRRQHALSVSFE